MEESAASPSWVILGRVPRVTASDADLPPPADLSLALQAPPRVALLTIPPRIFPGRTTPKNFPSVIAVDASGLLLLKADQGPATGPTVIDTPRHQEFGWRPTIPGYFLLDATTASAVPLPEPERIMHPGHLGLVSSPAGGGHYMVVELQPILGGHTADLLRFSSDVGEWVSKSVDYPLPVRMLAPNGVVSYNGTAWWVDLSWCLLTCDPFQDTPELRVVKLPPGKALRCREAWGELDKYRCVGVSAGKLRFVDMYRSGRGPAQISVWTLADPDSTTTEWTQEYEATFEEIWNDASFKATGLPRKVPVLALIHPTNPDVVYFFLDDHLLGVDVRARKVVECEVYQLVEPPRELVATRFVHAWQLPRALRSSDSISDLERKLTMSFAGKNQGVGGEDRGKRQGAAFAAGQDEDDLPQRQAAMEEAVRVMSNYNPDTMTADKPQWAMAFVNAELAHLRPIFMAIHNMPENTAAEIRAKEEAQAASREQMTRHFAKLLPGGSCSIEMVDDL